MALTDAVYILRIAGYAPLNSPTQQYAFVNRGASEAPLSYIGSSYALRRMSSVPYPNSGKLDPLGTIAAGGGCSVAITYDGDNEGVYGLLANYAAPYAAGGGGQARLAKYAKAADTVLTLEDNSAFTVGDLVSLGSEMVEVTAVGSFSPTITVTRAQLGTQAVDHPADTGTGLGPVLFVRKPDLIGSRVTIHTAPLNATSTSDETLFYRGIVTDIGYNRGTISLGIAPMSRLLVDGFGRSSRRWEPPALLYNGTPRLGRTASGAWDVQGVAGWLPKDRLFPSDDSWTYWRVVCGSKWAVFKFTSSEETWGDETVRLFLPESANPVQVGESMAAYPSGEWQQVFPASSEEQDNRQDVTRIEYVPTWTGSNATLANVLRDLLVGTATRPWTTSLQLSADDYEDATLNIANAAIDLEVVASPNASGALLIMPHIDRGTPIVEIIKEQVLAPLFLGIANTRTGKIRVVDHRNVLSTSGTLTEDEIATVGQQAPVATTQRRRRDVLRSVRFEAKRGSVEDLRIIVSEIAATVHATGKAESFEVGLLASLDAMDRMENRAAAVISIYERAPELVETKVRETLDLEQGDVVETDIAFLPDQTGRRGGGRKQRLLVLQSHADRAGVQRIVGLLIGRVVAAKRGPAATVVSWDAGTRRLSIDDSRFRGSNTRTHAEIWQVGDYIRVKERNLAPRSSVNHEVTAVGSSGGVDYLTLGNTSSLTTAAGDIITLAPYDVTPKREWAFYGDHNGELGADGDAADTWG